MILKDVSYANNKDLIKYYQFSAINSYPFELLYFKYFSMPYKFF